MPDGPDGPDVTDGHDGPDGPDGPDELDEPDGLDEPDDSMDLMGSMSRFWACCEPVMLQCYKSLSVDRYHFYAATCLCNRNPTVVTSSV